MNGSEHRVLVIGAAGLDMKVRPEEAVIESGCSNPARIRWGWGGVARNVAENLVRLGAEVQLITAVGDDEWGHALLAQLQDLHIDTEACIISGARPTASYVAIYQHDQRLRVAFDDMEVIREITPGYLYGLRGLVSEADMVCIDANLSARTLNTLFRLTAKYGVPVVADPTTALLAHRLHPYLPMLTAVTPDRDEAAALLGESLITEEAISDGARRLAHLGVALAVITLGADGLYYATAEENGRLPALLVDIVDPTGAGDALTAAVAYGLLEKVSLEETVRLGMAAAAQTIACKQTVCPTLNLESLYERLS